LFEKPSGHDLGVFAGWSMRNGIKVFLGPARGGKSTFLRCPNRMNDPIRGTRVTGKVLMD
jgi:ABC-type phosphate transport system ATPase subunit